MTADHLTAVLRARAQSVQSLKGLFQARIKGPGLLIPQTIQGALFFQRPDSFRIQGFTPFGTEIFELVTTERTYRLRIPPLGRVLEGRLEDLGRVGTLGPPFQMSLLAMSGLIGLAPVEAGHTTRLQEVDQRWCLEVLPEEASRADAVQVGARRLCFDPESLQVVEEQRFGEDHSLIAKAEFQDYRRLGGDVAPIPAVEGTDMVYEPIQKPFKISVQDGSGKTSVSITLQSLMLNPDLGPKELGLKARGAVREGSLSQSMGSQP
jgi:hypothetical protein